MPYFSKNILLRDLFDIKIPHKVIGDENFEIDSFNSINLAKSKTLTFWTKNSALPETKSNVIIVTEDFPYINYNNKHFILTKHPRGFFIEIIRKHYLIAEEKNKIHPTAIIHPNAIIKSNVTIEANVVINKNVSIGNNCIIKAGAVIGGEGFGFERNELGEWIHFPPFAGITIHDNVYIGSNTCIDSGTFEDTVIGEGTKIDNLVHIGHNAKIGKNCLIIANCMIGGGAVINDNTWIAPSVSIRDNIQIEEDVFIGMGSVVVKSVPKGITVVGVPAKPFSKK